MQHTTLIYLVKHLCSVHTSASKHLLFSHLLLSGSYASTARFQILIFYGYILRENRYSLHLPILLLANSSIALCYYSVCIRMYRKSNVSRKHSIHSHFIYFTTLQVLSPLLHSRKNIYIFFVFPNLASQVEFDAILFTFSR